MLSCYDCTENRYSLYISIFYKENKNILSDNVNGEIINRQEDQPLKCGNCESFYYNFTHYKCVCGEVIRRYCDECCDKHVIGVKPCDKCDIEHVEEVYQISKYFKYKFNRFLVY